MRATVVGCPAGTVHFSLVATATETSLSGIADSDAMSNSTSVDVRRDVIAVADTPRLVVTESARGDEDSAIPIAVTTLEFPDDSSDHLLILSCITGQLAAAHAENAQLPRIAQADGLDYFMLNLTDQLEDGGGGGSGGGGSATTHAPTPAPTTQWKFITVTPARDFAGNMSLNVTARAVERSSNDVAQNTTQVKLSVAAVADAPFISIENAKAMGSPQTSPAWAAREDSVASMALHSLRLNDTDGSEFLKLVLIAPCSTVENVTFNDTAMELYVDACDGSNSSSAEQQILVKLVDSGEAGPVGKEYVAFQTLQRWTGVADFGKSLAIALTPALHYAGVFNVSLAAVSRETNTNRIAVRNAWSVVPLTAKFEAVADRPQLVVPRIVISGTQGTLLKVNVTKLLLDDADGSETLTVIVRSENQYLGAVLVTLDGVIYRNLTQTTSSLAYSLSVPVANASDLALKMTGSERRYVGTVPFDLIATATEKSAPSAASRAANKTVAMEATWLAGATEPELALADASPRGLEDSWIPLNISRYHQEEEIEQTLSLWVLTNDQNLGAVQAGGERLSLFSTSGDDSILSETYDVAQLQKYDMWCVLAALNVGQILSADGLVVNVLLSLQIGISCPLETTGPFLCALFPTMPARLRSLCSRAAW